MTTVRTRGPRRSAGPRLILAGVAAVTVLASFALMACSAGAEREPVTPTPAPETALRISGSGTALPLVQKLAEAYRRDNPAAQFEFPTGTNSGGAIRGVAEGNLEIAVTNRALSEPEAAQALEYHAFANDAVAFVANTAGPLPSLSTAMLQEIYGGRVTNWQQLGGQPAMMIVLDRDADESMRKLVLLRLLNWQTVQAPAVVLTSARDMLSALENTPNAIGYSSLGLLRMQRPKNVQVLALDGVAPSDETLAAGAYPWRMTFGLVDRDDAPPAVHRFIEFVKGPAGSRILAEYGYVATTR